MGSRFDHRHPSRQLRSYARGYVVCEVVAVVGLWAGRRRHCGRDGRGWGV